MGVLQAPRRDQRHVCPCVQTVVQVKKGVEQLEVAEKYQKSARPIKCMAVLMVLIVIMVIIIAIRKTQ